MSSFRQPYFKSTDDPVSLENLKDSSGASVATANAAISAFNNNFPHLGPHPAPTKRVTDTTRNPPTTSITRGSRATGATCNLLPTNISPKHLRLWKNELLPWINVHMKDIIGEENTGIIEFLPSAEDPRPVIRIIAEDSVKVNSSLLNSKLEDDEATRGLYMIEVFQGDVRRSVNSEAYTNLPGNLYQKRPSHGASLGIANIPERQHLSETLGGYICLEYPGHQKIYGLTCHHMLKDYSNTGDNSGVKNGEVMLCQPAIGHAKAVLQRNSINCTDDHSALCPEFFGRVTCSSGYKLREYEGIPQLVQSRHQVCPTDAD